MGLIRVKIKLVIKNCGLEIVFWILAIILTIISIIFSKSLNSVISKDFTTYCLKIQNNINNVSTIIIGVYVAVVSILATSTTPIGTKMAQNRWDYKFRAIVVLGFINNIVLILFTCFVSDFGVVYYTMLLSLIIIVLSSFVKFLYIIMLIFTKNMDMIAKQQTEQNEYQDGVLNLLTKLDENTKQ